MTQAVISERIREITTTTGTGIITLGGTSAGYQTFLSGVGNNSQTVYCIADTINNAWEVGHGTVQNSGTQISRDVVYRSSNANGLVNFAAGSKTIFVPYPATLAVMYDIDSYTLHLSGSLVVPNAVSASIFSGSGAQITGVPSASYAPTDWGAIHNIPSGIVSSSTQIDLDLNGQQISPAGVTASFTGSFKGDGTNIINVPTASFAPTSAFASSILSTGITPGTMSGNFFIDGNVSIPGTASVGVLYTIFTTSSVIQQSGSTIFGDLLINTHQFTGSVLVTGSSQFNDITASAFKGDGSNITGVISASHANNADLAMSALTASILTLPATTTAFKYNVPIAATYGNDIQIASFPSASTEIDTGLRIKYDLTQVASMSLAARIEQTGSTNSQIRIQFSTDETNWFPIDGLSGPVLSCNVLGTNVGTAAAITASAQQGSPVILRLIACQGDGASNANIGSVNLTMYTRVPLYATTATQIPFYTEIPFVAEYGNSVVIPAVPAAATEVDTRLRFKYNLLQVASASIAVRVEKSSSAGTQLAVQYSTDENTWNYLDGVSGPVVNVDVTGSVWGPEVLLTTVAKTTAFLRLVSLNGNATASVELGNIHLILNSAIPIYAVNNASTASLAYTGSAGFQFLGDFTSSNGGALFQKTVSIVTASSGVGLFGVGMSLPSFPVDIVVTSSNAIVRMLTNDSTPYTSSNMLQGGRTLRLGNAFSASLPTANMTSLEFFHGGASAFSVIGAVTNGSNASHLVFGTGPTVTERMRITDTGNVGIGSNIPSHGTLEVCNSASAAVTPVLALGNFGTTANGSGTKIRFMASRALGDAQDFGYIYNSVADNTTSHEYGKLILGTMVNGTLTDTLSVYGSSVGINTNSPNIGGVSPGTLTLSGNSGNHKMNLEFQNLSPIVGSSLGAITWYSGSTLLADIDIQTDGSTGSAAIIFETNHLNNGTVEVVRFSTSGKGGILNLTDNSSSIRPVLTTGQSINGLTYTDISTLANRIYFQSASGGFPASTGDDTGIIGIDVTNNRIVYYSNGKRYYISASIF